MKIKVFSKEYIYIYFVFAFCLSNVLVARSMQNKAVGPYCQVSGIVSQNSVKVYKLLYVSSLALWKRKMYG